MTTKQTYQTPAQGGEQFPIECPICGGGIEFWMANGGHIVHPVCKTRPAPTCSVCGTVSAYDPCTPCHRDSGGYIEDTTNLAAGYAAARAAGAAIHESVDSDPRDDTSCSISPCPGCEECS